MGNMISVFDIFDDLKVENDGKYDFRIYKFRFSES